MGCVYLIECIATGNVGMTRSEETKRRIAEGKRRYHARINGVSA